MYRHRLRSPLRWLSATMSALMIVGLASIVGPWLIVAAPIVAGLFLLAPPLGIYRHDETPVPRADIHLIAVELSGGVAIPPNSIGFRLVLVNDSAATAEDFRIRLLAPHALVPPDFADRLLSTTFVGEQGRHWFVDTAGDATAITFRSGRASDTAIRCPAGGRLDLADLSLPALAVSRETELDYQVSGARMIAKLSRICLPRSR